MRNTWFCGSYFGAGFHEDGLAGRPRRRRGTRRPPPSLVGRRRIGPHPRQPETAGGMTPEMNSALYHATVVHQRLKPRRHRLAYRVCYGYFDLDELPELDRRLRTFSFNRAGIFSFHNRDHGPGDRGPAPPLGRGHDADRRHRTRRRPDPGDVPAAHPRLRLQSVEHLFLLTAATASLAAVLYEVSNTFGQRHCYLSAIGPEEGRVLRHQCAKEFYVSPFIGMDVDYRFRITVPGERSMIAISESDSEGPPAARHPQRDARPLERRGPAVDVLPLSAAHRQGHRRHSLGSPAALAQAHTPRRPSGAAASSR